MGQPCFLQWAGEGNFLTGKEEAAILNTKSIDLFYRIEMER